ncbi:MAG: rhodanese-like domain-containing protein [Sedimentisphaerales bacterium]|nr:rhodanese-like domain-containing protein [Sedimentisphaerales bacterium]
MRIRVTTVFFLACAILLAANPCVWAQHTNVLPEEARELINITDDLIIIDVREKSEYCGWAGHIPGALNYPWNSGVLQTRYEELPIDGKILVVCQSGGRSSQAANFLDSQGFLIVYNMLGGMYAWQWETAACKYAGGSGIAKDPYQIATAEDLILLGESPEDYDKHFILTADIDLDPNLPGRKVFDTAVIAPDVDPNDKYSFFDGTAFTGVFDGKGYIVSNLHIQGKDYIGLFGKLSSGGKISNLGLEAVNVNGTGYHIGGLVGGQSSSEIDMCYSTGAVHGGKDVGGLAGYCYGVVSNSYSSCSVQGEDNVGGLVGNNLGSITMSYSNSLVMADENVGGLVGCDFLCGRAACDYGNTTLSFWDIETSGQTISAGGEGKTTAEMMDPNTFISAGWDFVGETVNGPNDIWWILEGRDYPRLWWQLPSDDFNDGQPEPLWFVYAMEPESAWLEEVNGRLEANTAGDMEDVDAIYVSDGWRLDANEPFAVRVDYHFSKVGLGDGRLTLGLVPTIEDTVVQWAQFEVGTFDDNPFYLYEVRDDDWIREEVDDRFLDDGTLYLWYDPDLDELYFSETGYEKIKAIWTVKGLVRDRWGSESIYITLGGGSEDGMALTGEDAWLDNFTIDEGVIVQ